MNMCKKSLLTLLISSLFVMFALSACGGNDQPQVEKLSKAEATKKHAIDDQLRTRLRTTQSDR